MYYWMMSRDLLEDEFTAGRISYSDCYHHVQIEHDGCRQSGIPCIINDANIVDMLRER